MRPSLMRLGLMHPGLMRTASMHVTRMLSIATLATGLALAGCASSPDLLEQTERPPEELYNIALDEALYGDIENAAPLFDEVERQHPYSEWAVQSQLMAAWALYSSNNFPAAEVALERFIELNPAHPNVDYAYYLKAQGYYEQIVDVGRDASMTDRALEAFETLINRFPQSTYAKDAKLKIDLTRSHLAGKEMAIGRFYLRAGHYDAALRRFSKVIDQFDTTNQTPEALYRMTESYLALGLDHEAERAAVVLRYNYPDSIWTERTLTLIRDPETDYHPSLWRSLVDRATSLF